MKQITAKGQTVDEAVELALKELSTSKDKVNIKIIDSGRKGFFGVFGVKPAIVEVTVKHDPVAAAEEYLQAIVEKMDLSITIHKVKKEKQVIFQLQGERIAILIGKRGKTLNSLQFLTQLVANRYSDQYITIIVDAENYREKRKKSLEQLAQRSAEKAIVTKKKVALDPMPSNERKIIHNALFKNKAVSTSSTGNEPNRHIVITPL